MSDDYETPEWLMAFFKNAYDPCPMNAGFDGLAGHWFNPTFLNPPYSDPAPWIKKAIEESKRGVHVCLLLRVDPSTKWYRALVENGAKIFFANPRFSFKNKKGSPNFAVMLVFL